MCPFILGSLSVDFSWALTCREASRRSHLKRAFPYRWVSPAWPVPYERTRPPINKGAWKAEREMRPCVKLNIINTEWQEEIPVASKAQRRVQKPGRDAVQGVVELQLFLWSSHLQQTIQWPHSLEQLPWQVGVFLHPWSPGWPCDLLGLVGEQQMWPKQRFACSLGVSLLLLLAPSCYVMKCGNLLDNERLWARSSSSSPTPPPPPPSPHPSSSPLKYTLNISKELFLMHQDELGPLLWALGEWKSLPHVVIWGIFITPTRIHMSFSEYGICSFGCIAHVSSTKTDI